MSSKYANITYGKLIALPVVLLLMHGATCAADLIVSNTPFTPGGVVGMAPPHFAGGPELKFESGSLNSVSYRFYYSDGSGTFSGVEGGGSLQDAKNYSDHWNISCNKDIMTDKKECTVGKNELWISVGVGRPPIIIVGGEHFPNSVSTIRLDNNPPISSGPRGNGVFPSSGNAALLKKIKLANVISTRYMKWPNNYWIDDKWNLTGFKEAIQYASWAVTKIQ